MPSKSNYSAVVGILLSLVSAPAFATEAIYKKDVGTTKWFDSMRGAGGNSAMLRALAGSNGQAVVPTDCVEISGVITFVKGNPFAKGIIPALRIVSRDDWVDNVPRSPYIYQEASEPPNFYSVLKRDLPYNFVWLDKVGNEQKCTTWQVPPKAPKQLRLVLTVDAAGACKISQFGETAAK